MSRKKWQSERKPGVFTLARQLPVRFDVFGETKLPMARKARLAHQIRQDLWRHLQEVRGFCPAVRVEEDGQHLMVRAGGDVLARTYPKEKIQAKIDDLLANPDNRQRWLAHARRTR